MIDIDKTLHSYAEQIQDRITEFQLLLDDCMNANCFDLIAELKGIIENLHEHLEVTMSALTSDGKRKFYLVKRLSNMERLDLPVSN